MTPLEEGWFKLWHFRRVAIMGDAVRKVSHRETDAQGALPETEWIADQEANVDPQMAPSIGQGANMAIEDAAVLANSLWRAGLGRVQFDTCTMDLKIEEALKQYSTRLQDRTRQMCERSEFLVRLQTHDGLIKHILARYVIPSWVTFQPAFQLRRSVPGP